MAAQIGENGGPGALKWGHNFLSIKFIRIHNIHIPLEMINYPPFMCAKKLKIEIISIDFSYHFSGCLPLLFFFSFFLHFSHHFLFSINHFVCKVKEWRALQYFMICV